MGTYCEMRLNRGQGQSLRSLSEVSVRGWGGRKQGEKTEGEKES